MVNLAVHLLQQRRSTGKRKGRVTSHALDKPKASLASTGKNKGALLFPGGGALLMSSAVDKEWPFMGKEVAERTQ